MTTMPKRSKITWTDYSAGAANFVIGCTPISEGCANCYAERDSQRWGRDFAVKTYPEKLAALARWKPSENGRPYRRGPGSRPMCFVVDYGDLFHEAVPDLFLSHVFDVLWKRDDVDWQILTKRPQMARRFIDLYLGVMAGSFPKLPPNIWIGVTAENQRRADERIPILLQIPAAVRFVSIEPMLGPVDLTYYDWNRSGEWQQECSYLRQHVTDNGARIIPALNWVIVGGESGPNRRPFDKAWARAVRDQCRESGVAYFYKQSSGQYPGTDPYLDGEMIQEFPGDDDD